MNAAQLGPKAKSWFQEHWLKVVVGVAVGIVVLVLVVKIGQLGEGFCGKTPGYSTCYAHKQIYLNSCNPDEPTGHADVNLESQNGKLFIRIQAMLPYARGGVFHTMYGAYHAFLVSSRTGKRISLGTLARQGDRTYKLQTELFGTYGEYDEMQVWRQTEDYAPKMVLRGSITKQQCTSL